MATLAEIRTSIGVKLQDETFQSVSSASVDAYINDAIQFYKNQRFWFNEDEANITLNINDPVLPNVPSDFLQEVDDGGLVVVYNQFNYPVFKTTSSLYDAENIQGRGIPYVYTYRNGQFELYYFPDQAYLLKLRYLKDYPILSGDGNSNDFTVNAPNMIKYNALSRIYAESKQDDKMESYYTARANSEEASIKRRSSTLTGTGKLTLYSNLLS